MGALDKGAFFASLRARESGVFGSSLTKAQVAGMEAILDGGAHLPLSWLAYALATAYGETGRKMQPVVEGMFYSSATRVAKVFGTHRLQGVPAAKLARNPELLANTVYGGEWGRKNLGNTEPGDGWRFIGRGLPQTTGRANYGKIGKMTGLPLLTDPALALRPDIAVKILMAGIEDGVYTGVCAQDVLPMAGEAGAAAFTSARKIINRTDKAADYAAWAVAFQRALKSGGYRPVSASPPVRPDVEPPSPSEPSEPPTPAWLAALIAVIVKSISRRKS